MALGDVVGIRHGPVGDEHEQVHPVGEHALAQLASRIAHRHGGDDPIEPSVEVGKILPQGGVLERLSSSSDRYRPQQQPPEWRAERGIAAFDGIFGSGSHLA